MAFIHYKQAKMLHRYSYIIQILLNCLRCCYYNFSRIIHFFPFFWTNVRISMKHFSLLIVDECHRSKENFSNTKVAKYLIEQSDCPRILALTASPGSSKEIIREVCSNL